MGRLDGKVAIVTAGSTRPESFSARTKPLLFTSDMLFSPQPRCDGTLDCRIESLAHRGELLKIL